ncbi:MAG: hypothetical protein EHM23_12295 [Acidobacteria bacterium]|nr:MAG: hypothetical protein EHM23_12295 [Acidobacteriota bacterium]
MKRIAFLAVVVLLTVGFGFSAASQVEFVAKVKAIETESDEVGTLTMQLTSTFDMKVRVTEMTEIRGEGDAELSIKNLETGMLLKIEGIFTDAMILAKEIQVFEGVSAFEVKGEIEKVDTAAKTITLLGLVINVTDDTELNGVESLADLKAGDIVKVEGKIEDGLVATELKIVAAITAFRPPRISFEGIVTSVKEGEIKVLVEGVDEVVVRVSDETDVHGEVMVGVGVRVIGTIGEDLVVDAHKIIVQKLLQVAPEKLKLQPDQVRQVVVILHTFFDEDVEVKVVSVKPEIAELANDTVVIPAGKLTGKFDVKGKAAGETVIEVSLPDSMGGTKAEVQVLVEDKGGKPGDDGNGGGEKPGVMWTPGNLVLKTGQTRQGAIHLRAPAETALTVALSLKTGDTDVVQFPATVNIPQGAKYVFVTFTAGQKTGTVSVLAKLPDSAGGAEATLTLEVRAKEKN